jgi:biotin carboxyl carrier protein
MRHNHRWAVLALIIAGLVLAACGGTSSTASHPAPAVVKPIPEKNLNQLQLTEDAVRRLAIQTTAVREEQVTRKRIIGGEVVAVPEAAQTISASGAGTIAAPTGASLPLVGTPLSAGQAVMRLVPSGANKTPVDVKVPRATTLTRLLVAPGQTVDAGQALFETADISKVLVRAPVYIGEVDKVNRATPAQILPLARGEQPNGLTATIVELPAIGDARTSTAALYYLVDSANHGLAPGQRVRVELSLTGSGVQQKVVPYAAVIYDLHGDTWAYTNPQPLTYIREHIGVEYIDGDLAVLSQGPIPGTQVVTVGAAELFGTEFGIGK